MKSKIQSVKEVLASFNIDNLQVSPKTIKSVLKEEIKVHGKLERKRTIHNGNKI